MTGFEFSGAELDPAGLLLSSVYSSTLDTSSADVHLLCPFSSLPFSTSQNINTVLKS